MKKHFDKNELLKIALVLVLFSLSACNNSTSNESYEIPQNKFTPMAQGNDPAPVMNTAGTREYIDSAHFHIIRGNYPSGAKFIEVYQDGLTRIDHRKEYHENGRLKEEGLMTNANHIYVGTWKYYSREGKLDSIVNHDNKYRISYYRALEIAEKNGYKMPDMEVSFTIDKNKKYWRIVRWTTTADHSGQTGEAILIDTKSGKVTKPEYQPMIIF